MIERIKNELRVLFMTALTVGFGCATWGCTTPPVATPSVIAGPTSNLCTEFSPHTFSQAAINAMNKDDLEQYVGYNRSYAQNCPHHKSN